jgi:hypothetical protein
MPGGYGSAGLSHIFLIADSYQRQIQQTMQKCKDLIDNNRSKYMLNIKPTAPKINAYIKTHKDNNPIRTVIDNTQAPS